MKLHKQSNQTKQQIIALEQIEIMIDDMRFHLLNKNKGYKRNQ